MICGPIIGIRCCLHSDAMTKMLVFRDPERSVLQVREHRKRGKALFADRQG